MIDVRNAIILNGELNPWIDICIVPYKNFNAVKQLAEELYDKWFEEDTDEPIMDYFKRKLDAAGCIYEIYYAKDEED